MAISPIQNVTPQNMPQHLEGLDFHTMMMALVFERAETLDSVAQGQMSDMASKNERMKHLNAALQTARTAEDTSDDKQALTGDVATEVYNTLQEEGIPIPGGMTVHPTGDAAAAAELQDVLNLIDGRAGLGGYRGDVWWRADDIIAAAEKYDIDLGDINIKTWSSSGQQYVGPSNLSNEAAWEALEAKFTAKIAEVNTPSMSGTTDQWKALIDNIKTQIDSLSQDSQLDMIKLQGLIQKLNQTIEMGSNEIVKDGSTKSNTISNMAR